MAIPIPLFSHSSGYAVKNDDHWHRMTKADFQSKVTNGINSTYRIKSVKICAKCYFTDWGNPKIYLSAWFCPDGTYNSGTCLMGSNNSIQISKSANTYYSGDISSYFNKTSPFTVNTGYNNFSICLATSNIKEIVYYCDVWLEVEYEIPTHTATFKNYNGTVLQTVTVNNGATPSYTGATPTKPKDKQYTYTFSGWSPSLGAITGNTTYTAQFTAKLREYTIRADCVAESSTGKKCSVTGTGVYYYYNTVTLTAVNIPSYHKFSGWNYMSSKNGTQYHATNPWIFEINDEFLNNSHEYDTFEFVCYIEHTGFTLKANVSPDGNAGSVKYGIFLDYDGDGNRESWVASNTIPSGGYVVPYNEKDYTGIEAVPASGYKFVKWGDGNTVNPRKLSISGNVTHTAYFEKSNYTIFTYVSPLNSGSVSGGGSYAYGASVTLKATANVGYEFVKWLDGVTTSSRTVTVTGEAGYTAVFRVNKIYIGTSKPKKIYIGTQEVKEVYVGLDKVYG